MKTAEEIKKLIEQMINHFTAYWDYSEHNNGEPYPTRVETLFNRYQELKEQLIAEYAQQHTLDREKVIDVEIEDIYRRIRGPIHYTTNKDTGVVIHGIARATKDIYDFICSLPVKQQEGKHGVSGSLPSDEQLMELSKIADKYMYEGVNDDIHIGCKGITAIIKAWDKMRQ